MAPPQKVAIHISFARERASVFRPTKSKTDSGATEYGWSQHDTIGVTRIEFDIFVRASKDNKKERVPILFDTGTDRSGIRQEIADRIVGQLDCNPKKSRIRRWVLIGGVIDRFYAPLIEVYWSLADDDKAPEFKTEAYVIPSQRRGVSLTATVEKLLGSLIGWRRGDLPVSLFSARDLLTGYDIEMEPLGMTLKPR
jgi:hypothetical protein